MAELHVSCAVEGAYDAYAAVMLHSVLAHAPDVHLHLLHGPSLPPASVDALRRMADEAGAALTAHRIDPERVERLPSDERFTPAMWYRIFLPELLPDAERVLYLDVDTLALDDLAPLWAVDLSQSYLAAVTNVLMPHHRHRPAQLGLAGPESYFNSGVLLLNLEAMRRDGCTQALVACATERGAALEWPDQDALNLVLGERRVELHPRWNAMNSLRFGWSAEVFGRERVEEARRRPAIRHFEGPDDNKPWHPGCTQQDRHRWFVHRWGTPWPGTRLEFELHGRWAPLVRRLPRRLRPRPVSA